MLITRRSLIRIMVRGSLLYTLAPLSLSRAEEPYPETIEALKFLHGIEISVQRAYHDFAEQARAEGHPGIGNMFRSLSLGEEIHARNFRNLLTELGVDESGTLIETEVLDTKANLGKAIETELYHIEMVYPESVEHLRDERHEKVLRFVNYAWEAEKRHRDLLKQMRRGMGFLYRFMADRIEEEAKKNYICPLCGSSFEELPPSKCPVCQEPVEEFYLVVYEEPLRKVKDLP